MDGAEGQPKFNYVLSRNGSNGNGDLGIRDVVEKIKPYPFISGIEKDWPGPMSPIDRIYLTTIEPVVEESFSRIKECGYVLRLISEGV
ncbi:MAG: hypothetical protein HY518_02500 [Candidatus Aenigmarchaeota archaeon]|nr:hypothetical protein [Candidatus Aenigmarchaeota archaeon]